MTKKQVSKVKESYKAILSVYLEFEKKFNDGRYFSSYDVLDYHRLTRIVDDLEDLILDNE